MKSLLYEFILRIRVTVELMRAANEIYKDYEKIINLTLYLMLSEPLQIEMELLSTPYKTCQHFFRHTMAKANSMTLVW